MQRETTTMLPLRHFFCIQAVEQALFDKEP